jgi:hypothetical protein
MANKYDKYIESANIEVFPMAKERGTNTPGNRLLTEKNVSNFIRQLLPMLYADGFMISNSEEEGDGGKILHTIEFNLHGYYFKITDLDVSSGFGDNTVIYAEMDIDDNDEISFSDDQPNETMLGKFGGFKLTTVRDESKPGMELFSRTNASEPFTVSENNFIRNMIKSIGGVDGKY